MREIKMLSAADKVDEEKGEGEEWKGRPCTFLQLSMNVKKNIKMAVFRFKFVMKCDIANWQLELQWVVDWSIHVGMSSSEKKAMGLWI